MKRITLWIAIALCSHGATIATAQLCSLAAAGPDNDKYWDSGHSNTVPFRVPPRQVANVGVGNDAGFEDAVIVYRLTGSSCTRIGRWGSHESDLGNPFFLDTGTYFLTGWWKASGLWRESAARTIPGTGAHHQFADFEDGADSDFNEPRLAITFAPTTGGTPVQVKNFRLNATAGWTKTGEAINFRSQVTVRHQSGTWRYGPSSPSVGPKGGAAIAPPNQGYPLSGAPIGALVARAAGGQVFLIGASKAFSPPPIEYGEFEIGINDSATVQSGYADNSGFMIVSFAIRP